MEQFNAAIKDEDGESIPVNVRTSAVGVAILGADEIESSAGMHGGALLYRCCVVPVL